MAAAGKVGAASDGGAYEQTQVDGKLSVLISTGLHSACVCQNNVHMYFTIMHVLP